MQHEIIFCLYDSQDVASCCASFSHWSTGGPDSPMGSVTLATMLKDAMQFKVFYFLNGITLLVPVESSYRWDNNSRLMTGVTTLLVMCTHSCDHSLRGDRTIHVNLTLLHA